MRIALADLTHLNEVNAHNFYVPLNVGLLAAYAKQRFGRDVDIVLFKDANELIGMCRDGKPDIVGFAAYYWKEELNRCVIRLLREALPESLLVMGGPCIDTDPDEQAKSFVKYQGLDAIVPNEGELALGNIIEAKLGDTWGKAPVDGVTYRQDGELVRGKFINLSADLATIPSPYLSGFMDKFLEGKFAPMIQTSRTCPYTCAFCVSGKDRGKLRAFPLEQVREDIRYIAKNFKGHKGSICYIVDENFGIMKRDLEVADYIVEARKDLGYPNYVYYYNDKRFTQISRDIHERLGKICHHGVCLSLQSDNPEVLKAIHRRNLTDEQIVSALSWARGLGLRTSTELIFGLPGETVESYCALIDKCARQGFNMINSYTMIMFDGIEMNRQKYRADHKLKTMRRAITGSVSNIEGALAYEAEEVVVSSESFSFDDFILVSKITVLLQYIYGIKVQSTFFNQLITSGRSLTGFLRTFLAHPVDDEHKKFLERLDAWVRDGIMTDRQLAEERARTISEGQVRYTPLTMWSAETGDWVPLALLETLRRYDAEQMVAA